jgi:hypothetical protein
MAENRGVYMVWWGNLRERDHFEDPGIGGRIILSWTFGTQDVWAWTRSIWLKIGTGDGHL